MGAGTCPNLGGQWRPWVLDFLGHGRQLSCERVQAGFVEPTFPDQCSAEELADKPRSTGSAPLRATRGRIALARVVAFPGPRAEVGCGVWSAIGSVGSVRGQSSASGTARPHTPGLPYDGHAQGRDTRGAARTGSRATSRCHRRRSSDVMFWR